MAKETTCCFTGHRILDRGFSYDRLYRAVIKLIEVHGIDTFIAGGALGFDTHASLAVLQARDAGYKVQLHIYAPCNNQSAKWSYRDKAKYDEILKQADYVDMPSVPYFNGCMQQRNFKMVDASSFCLCYFNGSASGTGQTVRYARAQGLKVGNLYNE